MGLQVNVIGNVSMNGSRPIKTTKNNKINIKLKIGKGIDENTHILRTFQLNDTHTNTNTYVYS